MEFGLKFGELLLFEVGEGVELLVGNEQVSELFLEVAFVQAQVFYLQFCLLYLSVFELEFLKVLSIFVYLLVELKPHFHQLMLHLLVLQLHLVLLFNCLLHPVLVLT